MPSSRRRRPGLDRSAASHLRHLGSEVVLGRTAVDPLTAFVTNEASDGHPRARGLASADAKLLDGLARRHHRLLLEQRDLRVPLVELALDDLRPGRLRLRLGILAHLRLEDLA